MGGLVVTYTYISPKIDLEGSLKYIEGTPLWQAVDYEVPGMELALELQGQYLKMT